jgi:hypothetical protein
MSINIEKISKYLAEMSVSENYNWPIPFDRGEGKNIFSKQDIDTFKDLTNFQSNIYLKKVISEKITSAINEKENQLLKQIFEWTVHDWGGIKNGRNNIDTLYQMGIEAIKKEKLTFNRIASISKILSFYKPSHYIIYDSRIAYSLNAIMFLIGASDKYFPVPAGKNSKMNAFNIEVLIRLKHKPNVYLRTGNKKLIANADKSLFFKENEAYSIINETVKKINMSIYKDDPDKHDKPYYTEMLLFGIADTLIYDKIFNTVKIDLLE